MQFHETIFENDSLKLMINYSGVNVGVLKNESIKLHFYAFDKITGKQLFDAILDIKGIRKLYEHLNQISIITDSTKTVSGKFIETSEDIIEFLSKVQWLNADALRTILSKIPDKEKVMSLLTTLSTIELENLTAAHKQQIHQVEIDNLEKLLLLEDNGNIVEAIKSISDLSDYAAGQSEKIFQNWIEKNLWIFGVEYVKKHDARKIALFSEGDILMESMDGFLDLIELKRPKLDYEIFKYDSSHKCYYPSPDLSKVIGQCLFYLQKMDDYKLNLEKDYKIKILRPRIKVILGRTKEFSDDQFSALRMLNSNLNHIQIISFDYLLSCGRKLISHYDQD